MVEYWKSGALDKLVLVGVLPVHTHQHRVAINGHNNKPHQWSWRQGIDMGALYFITQSSAISRSEAACRYQSCNS